MKLKNTLLLTFAIVLLALICFAFGLLWSRSKTSQYSFSMNSQTVIQEVKSLNRLETASFTIEKVIDAGTTGSKLQELLFGDRILLIAHGQVIAGYDLSKVSKEDIQVQGPNLTINLPAPEIFLTTLDNSQTRVYDRKQGLLTKGDQNLESQARAEAETVLRNAACTGGILSEAEKNGRSQLTTLFKTAGFTNVIINNPPGKC